MVDSESIVQIIQSIAGLITSIGVISAFVWAVHNKMNEPMNRKADMENFKKETKQQMNDFDKRLTKIEEEQMVQTKCLLAIMDGLKQLGANGNVTHAKEDLEQHLLKSAYATNENK